MKSNQKSSHPKCFFAALALPCKSGKTTGCNIFAQSRMPTLMQKVAMPLPTLKANKFYPISPEAVWLTFLLKENFVLRKIKRAERPAGKPGQGVWPVGGRFFPA
jgi:hypothetical protein